MPHTRSKMYYEDHGEGERTIVMLPGFGCSTEPMANLLPHLPGYRVVIFDLPGHVGSAEAPASGQIPEMGATVHDALREVVDGPYVLLGYSLGGAIALRVALDHPDEVTALVGLNPWNAAGTDAEDQVMAGFDAAFGNLDVLQPGVAGISLDPTRTTPLVDSMMTVTEEMWHGWLAGGALTSQADELGSLRVPTCYVLGGKDVVVDQAKQLDDVRAIPGGRAVLLADVGHLSAYEAPEVVGGEITGFLDTVA